MAFAKHETFHIREGWLYKGMEAITRAEEGGQLPTIFLDSAAPEKLGIGRNMVRSLRFWMQATGLAHEHLEQRQRVQRLTPFGQHVWAHDRYVTDTNTLWLIHYHLVCNRELATAWYWFFNHFSPGTFDQHRMLDALHGWVISEYPEREIAASSLKKDINCLLQTYLASDKPHIPEDLIESPLARLHLINRIEHNRQKRYRRERADSDRIHPLVILYVLVDRKIRQHQNQNQNQTDAQEPLAEEQREVYVSEVLREENNIGRVFHITTTGFMSILTTLKNHFPDFAIEYTRTAGLDTLTLPQVSLSDILTRCYAQRRWTNGVA